MNHKGALKTENHWAVLAMLSKIYNFKLPFGNHLSRCMEEYNDSAPWKDMDSTTISRSNTKYAEAGAKDLPDLHKAQEAGKFTTLH